MYFHPIRRQLLETTKQRLAIGDVSIDAPTALVLTGLGLLYCYVASAPITIIHASRMFRKSWFNRLSRYLWTICWLSAIAFVVSMAYLGGYGHVRGTSAMRTWALAILALPASWVLIAQMLCILRLHADGSQFSSSTIVGRCWDWLSINITGARFDQVTPPHANFFERFYADLARARALHAGLRESYTHMREHANSIFIALLELSLASLILFTLKFVGPDLQTRLTVVAALFFAWIVPGVFVWAQANRLESSLLNR
ncbi:MAG: hypothetical protein JSR18_06305 [Proteobacteria bacterium]|nr:hypothetical protein [Pseudomonadota bacterium]